MPQSIKLKRKIAQFGAATSDWMLDEVDPATGIEKWVQFYEHGFVTQTRYPAIDFAEDNKRAVNDSAYDRFGNGKVTGSIPLNEFFADGLDKAFEQHDEAFVRKYLTEHPEYRRFRSVG